MTSNMAMVRGLVVALVLYGATCVVFGFATGSPVFGSVDMLEPGRSGEQVMSTMIRNSAQVVFIYLLCCGVISLVGVGLASRGFDDALVTDPVSATTDRRAPNTMLGTLVGVVFTVLFSIPVYVLVGRLLGAWMTVGDDGVIRGSVNHQWQFMVIPPVVLLVIGLAVAALLGGWVGARFGARSTLAVWATAAAGTLALVAVSNLLHGTQVLLDEPVSALQALVVWIVGVFLALAVLWLPGMWLGVRMGRSPVAPHGAGAADGGDEGDAGNMMGGEVAGT